MPKFPLHYYFSIVIFILISILFWFFVLQNKLNHSKQIEIERYRNNHKIHLPQPINPNDLIVDSINNRKIVANLLNIALKNKEKSIYEFAQDFKNIYQDSVYEIVYIDSVINRLQVKLPTNLRQTVKDEIKGKMVNDSLLVWDEMMFKPSVPQNLQTAKNETWHLNYINIQNAWKTTLGNPNTVIAIIDNGFDLNHNEIKNKSTKPYNPVNKNTNISIETETHGTHVASIALGQRSNSQDSYNGICPDCTLMPIQVANDNGLLSMSSVIDGILYAIKNNASVINLSIGTEFPIAIQNLSIEEQKQIINSTASDVEEFWNDLFKYAYDRNIVCVIAAGNSSVLTGIDPFQRSQYTIKVGAVSRNQIVANFSNFGQLNTIYAPGESIYGAKPFDEYQYLDGTSMAAPIVSGFIGLLKSAYPTIKFDEIISSLNRNSEVINGVKQLKINNI